MGAAAGCLARFGLSELFPQAPDDFPWTTFLINVTGSALLALLPALAVVLDHHLLPPLLGTGVLGGYTTFSTYAEETRALLDQGETATAATYLTGTLAACLIAVALASRLSTRAQRRRLETEEGVL